MLIFKGYNAQLNHNKHFGANRKNPNIWVSVKVYKMELKRVRHKVDLMRIGQDPRRDGKYTSKVSEARSKARYAMMSKLANEKIDLRTYLDVMGRTSLIDSAKGPPKINRKAIEKVKQCHEKQEAQKEKKTNVQPDHVTQKATYKPIKTPFHTYLTGEPRYKKKKLDPIEPISKEKGTSEGHQNQG